MVLVSLVLSWMATAAAVEPGDLLFTGFNCDNDDEASLLVLAPIPPGTTLSVTDDGWQENGTFRDAEGTASFTLVNGASPGSVILLEFSQNRWRLDNNQALSFTSVDDMPQLSTSGDQLFLFAGTRNIPQLIAGITNESWELVGDIDSNESHLPAVIEDFAVYPDNDDNAAYDCSEGTSGTRAELIARLTNAFNWDHSNGTRYDLPPSCDWQVVLPEVCGDDEVGGSEVCDGSDLDGADCTDLGYSEPGGAACDPECDQVDYSGCVATCGDGEVEHGEDCDGGGVDTASCDADCTSVDVNDGYCNSVVEDPLVAPADCVSVCGDGLVSGGEACDGDELDGATCADFNFESGELSCDDCAVDSSACFATCGNEVVEPGEDCDEGGNTADCTDQCTEPRCGDGLCSELAGEGPSDCPSDCDPVCGDGVAAQVEDCDDGNTTPDDGCDADCNVEPGFVCTGNAPTVCLPDADGDGVADEDDNCPFTDNPTQEDADGDGIGDACAVEDTDPGIDTDTGVAVGQARCGCDSSPPSGLGAVLVGLLLLRTRRRVA